MAKKRNVNYSKEELNLLAEEVIKSILNTDFNIRPYLRACLCLSNIKSIMFVLQQTLTFRRKVTKFHSPSMGIKYLEGFLGCKGPNLDSKSEYRSKCNSPVVRWGEASVILH